MNNLNIIVSIGEALLILMAPVLLNSQAPNSSHIGCKNLRMQLFPFRYTDKSMSYIYNVILKQCSKTSKSQFHCFQYPLASPIWFGLSQAGYTQYIPHLLQTLRLLSFEHFPKASLEKKTHPILQGRSWPCSPALLPQPHLCFAQKQKSR